MSERATVKRIFDFRLLRRVLHYAAPYKRKFIISVVLAIFLACISPVRPHLIQVTINDYVKAGTTVSGEARLRIEDMILWITIIQIVLLLIESAVRFYFSYVTAWLGQTVVKDLRVRVYNKILGLNLSQFDTTQLALLQPVP